MLHAAHTMYKHNSTEPAHWGQQHCSLAACLILSHTGRVSLDTEESITLHCHGTHAVSSSRPASCCHCAIAPCITPIEPDDTSLPSAAAAAACGGQVLCITGNPATTMLAARILQHPVGDRAQSAVTISCTLKTHRQHRQSNGVAMTASTRAAAPYVTVRLKLLPCAQFMKPQALPVTGAHNTGAAQ